MTNDTDHSSTSQAAFERASSLLRAGDLRGAETTCRGTLEKHPSDGNLLYLLGAVLVRQGRPGDAENALRPAIMQHPDFASAHEELGNALMAQKKTAEAVDCFHTAIRLEPDNGQVHFKLSRLLTELGRVDEAEQARKNATKHAPGQVAFAVAVAHRQAGRIAEAEKLCAEILQREPRNADVLRFLASCATDREQFGDAIVLLRRALEFAPESVRAWIALGNALLARQDFAAAIEAFERSAAIEPGLAQTRLMLGKALAYASNYHAAIDAFRAGLDIEPDSASCLVGLGHCLKTLGRTDEATDSYRAAIDRHPAFGEAYWSLADLKAFRFEPADVNAMEIHADDARLPENTRIHFSFALGKACEDAGEFAAAFDHYGRGNSARRARESYDPVDTEELHDRIIDVFTPEFLAARAGGGEPDPAPIFIVGLPRSGSTLIEQILASHSQVDGTRELSDLPSLIPTINAETPGETRYPEVLNDCANDQLRALGQQYLTVTQRHRGGLPYFTDKLPNNFSNIGLLALILPNAKIINARRHPLDSCMGSFKQLFASGQAFTYDLQELGEYYLDYQRLMDHWHRVLPGRVLDVHYERLVGNQEDETRRLLEYCTLPWEDACLRFHETERAINSASSEQVRRPIYASALNHWRNYEEQLADLIEVLEPLLNSLPADQRPSSL
jgi:tetratricopeptide (TPR) repeat protein